MAIYARDQLNSLVEKIRKKNISQVYLLFGERYLCQQAAEKIIQALLPEGSMVRNIDGLQEDFSLTLEKITSYSLFQGKQIYRINDTRLFLSEKNSKSLWQKSFTAYKENDKQLAGFYLRRMIDAAGLDVTDLANDPGVMSSVRWKKLFRFSRPQENLEWTGELLQSSIGDAGENKKVFKADPAKLFAEKISAGLPEQNVLLLLAEEVDRRKSLFKTLTDKFVVVDLSVESGSSSRAQKSQRAVFRQILQETLDRFNKTMQPEAVNLLFERVGFHPVAVAMEAEKLALYSGSRTRLERSDIDLLIGRTRQEALFELTDYIGKMNLEQALLTAEHLQDNGIHPLAIIATIRNYLHSLLLFRALQELPEAGYSRSMSAAHFQQQCLPRLKDNEQWKKELTGHPYAIYMQFKTAAAFELSTLKNWIACVLQADLRLKGSFVAPDLVIQHLLINLLGNVNNTCLKKYRGGLHLY